MPGERSLGIGCLNRRCLVRLSWFGLLFGEFGDDGCEVGGGVGADDEVGVAALFPGVVGLLRWRPSGGEGQWASDHHGEIETFRRAFDAG